MPYATYNIQNSTVAEWNEAGRARFVYMANSTAVPIYDLDFTHATTFSGIAAQIEDAINDNIDDHSLSLSHVTVETDGATLTVTSDDESPVLLSGTRREDEECHLVLWTQIADVAARPATDGLPPEVFADGDWAPTIAARNFPRLLGLGVKRFILGWVFGGTETPYTVGYYRAGLGGGPISDSPLGPRQLVSDAPAAVSNFVSSWYTLTSTITAAGGELIAYMGAPEFTFTPVSDYIEWCQEAVDCGMSVMFDTMGAISTVDGHGTPPSVPMCEELFSANIKVYCEPNDENASEYAHWHDGRFGALSTRDRADLAWNSSGWFTNSIASGKDNIVLLTPDPTPYVATNIEDSKKWMRRGWAAAWQFWYEATDEQITELVNFSWDTDLISENFLSLSGTSGTPTAPGTGNSLPIVVHWWPYAEVYTIVLTEQLTALNPTTGEFEELGTGTACEDGVDHAVECEESECLPGFYKGSVPLGTKGNYIIAAYEQDGSEPNLQADEVVGVIEIDWDGTQEITFLDLLDGMNTIEEQISLLQQREGGLTPLEHRWLQELIMRKHANRPR